MDVFSLENLKEKGCLDNLGINGKIILKLILNRKESCALYLSASVYVENSGGLF